MIAASLSICVGFEVVGACVGSKCWESGLHGGDGVERLSSSVPGDPRAILVLRAPACLLMSPRASSALRPGR